VDFPLLDLGIIELNQNPHNYFQDIEQAAFAPDHIVDGRGYSPDKMLQGRLLSYPDAHRYRLGTNYEQIPVNRCPFGTTNYQREGQMRMDGNGSESPNYFPNSFDEIIVNPACKEPYLSINSHYADWYDRNCEGENDHFS
jgi:catalase